VDGYAARAAADDCVSAEIAAALNGPPYTYTPGLKGPAYDRRLDDLALYDFLRVGPLDPAGVLEAGHHLVEGGRAAAHTVARQFAAQHTTAMLPGEEGAQDDELEWGQ
jgi:hypothetical protein